MIEHLSTFFFKILVLVIKYFTYMQTVDDSKPSHEIDSISMSLKKV